MEGRGRRVGESLFKPPPSPPTPPPTALLTSLSLKALLHRVALPSRRPWGCPSYSTSTMKLVGLGVKAAALTRDAAGVVVVGEGEGEEEEEEEEDMATALSEALRTKGKRGTSPTPLNFFRLK